MKNINLRLLLNVFYCAYFAVVLAPNTGYAVVEAVQFDHPQQEQRYKKLIGELRCLVCQNQNLADSDAPLAKDLREITLSMLKEGKSDAEIATFMRDRYGDFVLYRPRFGLSTLYLWLGPFVLLLLVITALFIRLKQKHNAELLKSAEAGDQKLRIKVQNLLRETPNIDSQDR